MARLELHTFVQAPRDQVFAAFTDVEGWADMIDGIVKVERIGDGPVGNGTRWKETRVMFKKEHTEEMWIEDFQAPSSYAVAADSCGSKFKTTFTFQEQDGGTKVDMLTETQAVSLFAKIMSPLGALMMGPMKKAMQKDMDDLKAAIEKGPATPAAAE